MLSQRTESTISLFTVSPMLSRDLEQQRNSSKGSKSPPIHPTDPRGRDLHRSQGDTSGRDAGHRPFGEGWPGNQFSLQRACLSIGGRPRIRQTTL